MRRKLLTDDEYELMQNAQGGGCAICGQFPVDRALAVDHDHDTGKVRGLLCPRCNVGLGCFEDSATMLERALDYLEGLTDTVTVTERVAEWREMMGSRPS